MNKLKYKIFVLLCITICGLYCNAQQELDFAVEKNNIKLFGTYLIPKTSKPPIVLIIAGSGPTDRNGDNPINVKSQSYKLLAEELAKNNIASLRYDKRGIGESIVENLVEKDIRFEHSIDDAKLIIDEIMNSERFGNIFILGHSEGSLVGMEAAINNTNVKGYISVAGAGKGIDEILKEQLKKYFKDDTEENKNIFKALDTLANGDTLKYVNPSLFSLFRPSIQPYMISWMKYNPATEITKLTIPILIINGENDIQVSSTDAQLLFEANKKNKLVIIPNMTHTLKDSKGKNAEEQVEAYTNPNLELNKILVKEIVDFIIKNK